MLRLSNRVAIAPLRCAPFGVTTPCACRYTGGIGTGNIVFRSGVRFSPSAGIEQGTGLILMDDGEDDERAAAECMREARKAAAVAIRAGLAEDRALKLAAITTALNASNAAILAIECWRLELKAERERMTGEPVFVIEPVPPQGSGSKH